METGKNLFNLLAGLIKLLNTFPSVDDPDELLEEHEDKLEKEVQEYLTASGIFTYAAQFRLPSDVYEDIINWCTENRNFYLIQIILCKLDMQLPNHIWVDSKKGHPFRCLNDNEDETGILILPHVKGPQTIHKMADRQDPETIIERGRVNATKWDKPLNARLRNFYFVEKEELDGFDLENVIYEGILNERQLRSLKIAVTPLCSKPIPEVLNYDDNVVEKDASGNPRRFLDFIQVINPSEIEADFAKCYEVACKNDVDILIAPEMFGTTAMYGEDEMGYNHYFRQLGREFNGEGSLGLILAPSYWNKNQNKANFYTRSGKKIGEQYKQHRYGFHGKHGPCKENLKNIPKKICLIHIPNWGRLAILICVDFLHAAYRQLIVSALQADFLLCPSFSPGNGNFEKALPAQMEFDCYAIWINCCTASRPNSRSPMPDYVGGICAPTVSSRSPIVRLTPTCQGTCRKGCLFVAELPLNCAGESIHEDAEIKCYHIWEGKEEENGPIR